MTFQKSPIMVLMLILFLTLVGANVYRVITAVETDPGMVVEDAYLSGERYGEVLAAKRKLDEQGWVLDFLVPELTLYQTHQTYKVNISQHDQALKNAKVVIDFERSVGPKHRFSTPMKFDGSLYIAQISLPLKGRWNAVVKITKDSFSHGDFKALCAVVDKNDKGCDRYKGKYIR